MPRKRKPFHVYKRNNGVYYVRLPRAGGGYEHLSTGHTVERNAFREAERMAERTAGDGSETFHAAVQKFARDYAATELSPRSAERYATSYTALKPTLGHLTLAEIGTAEIDTFVVARRKANITDRTIRRDLMFVSSVFSQAAVWQWTNGRNPVADYMRMQGRKSKLKRKVRRTRYLTLAEEARLVAAAHAYLAQPGQPSQQHERLMSVAAIFVSIDQGLRRGELTAALRDHIDRGKGEHGEWYIPRCDDPDEDGPNKSEPRRIPLFKRAREWLDKLPVHPEAPWVFWHGLGQRYGTFDQVLRKLCERAGITDHVTWHDLRRTCGCRRLQDDRWDITRVSQFLGHQDVSTTLAHYAFLSVENLHEEMKRSG
jgi:integrase